MKIYKITQIQNNEDNTDNFPVWLAKKLLNYQYDISNSVVRTIKKWAEESNPNLQDYGLEDAYYNAKKWLEKQTTSIKDLKPEDITTENKQDMANSLSYFHNRLTFPYTSHNIKIVKIIQPSCPSEPFLVKINCNEHPDNIFEKGFCETFETKDGIIFRMRDP